MTALRTSSGQGLSSIGLGCSRIGSFGNPVPIPAVRGLLRESLDLGVNVFDTADVYGQGESEREIGRAIAGHRDEAFVMTKVGKRFSARMRFLRPLKPIVKSLLAAAGKETDTVTSRRKAHLGSDFEVRHLERAVHASLRRLGVATVDGLLLHSPPAPVIRSHEVLQLLDRLSRAGKVRHYGVSCDDHAALEAAAAIEGLSLLQIPLDVLDEADRSGLAARIRERGVAVFVREVIRLSPGIAPAKAVARACGRPIVTTTIVGTSRIEHLRELQAAASKGASAGMAPT